MKNNTNSSIIKAKKNNNKRMLKKNIPDRDKTEMRTHADTKIKHNSNPFSSNQPSRSQTPK